MDKTINNGDSILQFENVTKRFPGVLALDSVSFDVLKGEVHALVGENGGSDIGNGFLPLQSSYSF
jgi:ABC-type sugar transport system ATPase subunit